MKSSKFILLALCLSVSASAAPYFRPLDPSHIQPVFGALLAPEDMSKSEGASLLPLITHSPKDGCMLPSVVCEDWTPLAVGASMSAGKITLDVAPLANVLPWMVALAEAAMPPGWHSGLAWMIPADGQKVTFSAGPAWEYRQVTNKGYFRVFTGLALHF